MICSTLRSFTAAIAVLTLAFASATASAQSTWIFNGDGLWNDAANWDTGVPNSPGVDVIIDDGDSAVTVDLDVIVSVADLTIGENDALNITSAGIGLHGGDVFNDGIIRVNPTGASINTTLDPNAITTFSGMGEIILNASSDATPQHAQLGIATNDFAVINGTGHTISGTGQILSPFTNQANATVVADVAGRTLFIKGTSTNEGTYRATNGGILQLDAGITNTGGTIEAAGGTVKLDGATITGGTLDSSGGGTFEVTAQSTIDGLINNAAINVDAGNSLIVRNTIENNGIITVNDTAGAGNTTLDPNTITTFTGTGEIVLNASSDTNPQHAQIGIALNDFLVINGADHTVRGVGRISTSFTNEGTVTADGVSDGTGNTLLLDGGPGGPKTNNGIMQATAGGNLKFNTTVNNENGSIDPNGGTVELAVATINGGTITSGTVNVTGSSTLNGGTGDLTTAATIDVDAGISLFTRDTIINNGTITINDTAGATGNTTLDPQAITTLAGTGEVVLNASSDAAPQHAQIGIALNDFLVINGADHTIRGVGQIVTTFTNEGTVTADGVSDGTGNTLLVNGGLKTNNNIMQATAGGNLKISSIVNNENGSIEPNGGTVELAAATINGGTITSGAVNVTSNSTLNGGTGDLTTAATIDVDAGLRLFTRDTIINNGTITINDTAGATGNTTLDPEAITTLAGTGEVVLNTSSDAAPQHAQIGIALNDFRVINGEDHTIRGVGQIVTTFTNEGTVTADGVSDGTGNILLLNGGLKTNSGTYQALDGGVLSHTAGLTNLSAGTLTGGTYRSVETGGGSTLAIAGTALDTIASGTGVELSGANAIMTFGGTNVEDSLTTNNGIFRIFDGHTLNMTNALTNGGIIYLGGDIDTAGAILAPATLTSGGNIIQTSAGAAIDGHGTVNNSVVGGRVTASGGTLIINNGIIDNANFVSIRAGAALDLSSATGDSDTDTLIHAGTDMNLGANDILVRNDYNNLNFGTGNSFDHRANVTGTGLILADPAATQSITGTNIANGATATPELALGVIRNTSGGLDETSATFRVNNGASGPALRGAIQTTGLDPQISVAGGDQNWGALANSAATGDFTVTLAEGATGGISGTLGIVNNFDNVANQTLTVAGEVWNPAVQDITMSIDFGNVRQSAGVAGESVTIANDGVIGAGGAAFTEDLVADNFGVTGDFSQTGPSSVTVAAQNSDSSVGVAIDTTNAGAKSGNLTMDTASTGATDLADLDLGGKSVALSGNVFREATFDATPMSVDIGIVRVGDSGGTINQVLTAMNTAAADGSSENLDGAFDSASGTGISGSGSFTALAAGASNNTDLNIAIDTTAAGDRSGSATFGFESNGQAFGLGSNIALGDKVVNITGQVNNAADPRLAKHGGDGTVLSNSAVKWTLDLGTIDLNTGDATAEIRAFNNAPAAFSDVLDGVWDLNGGSGAFSLTGFGTDVSDVAGGSFQNGYFVSLLDDNAGAFSHSIFLDPVSQNASSDLALAQIELMIMGTVNDPSAGDQPLLGTDPANGGTLDFGFVLVGQSGTETAEASNVGDAGTALSGTFGDPSDPEFAGVGAGAFGPLDTTGPAAERDYTYTPTEIGADSDSFAINSNAGSSTINLAGEGVAPIADLTDGDAGFVRVGDTGSLQALIDNIGNGNLSGEGAISNLNGDIEAASGSPFSGAGGTFSIADGGQDQFDFDFAPTSIGVANENIDVNLDNGNPDGTNSLLVTSLEIAGTGVGPVAAFDGDMSGMIDFGTLQLGDMAMLTLTVSNEAILGPDNDALTDLTLIIAALTGDDDFEFLTMLAGTVVRKGGADFDIEFKFTADELGFQTATFVLDTDQGAALGGDGQDFTFQLKANVVDGNVIPTPSAFATGLFALIGMTARRRRR